MTPEESVRALLPMVHDTAGESERAGRIAHRLFLALRDAGLFRLCVPRSLGGEESPPATVLDVVEQMATMDAGTAWCVMIGATTGVVSGHLPVDTARDIYGTPTSVVVGPFAPLGVAQRHGDGYLLTGRWPYVSMCRDASWIVGGGLDEDSSRRLFFFPAKNVVVHDTWQVMGLRASGSNDVEVREVAVPSGYTIPLDFEEPAHDAALYRFPVLGLLAAAISSVALGIARAAIDDVVSLAAVKTPTYAIRHLQERPLVQLQIGQAEAELRGARAFLREAVADAWDTVQRGDPVDLRQRAMLRLAAAQATTTSAGVTDLMYTAGGGTSNYLHNPLQRRFRDVHAATQHVMVSSGVIELAGRVLLGLKVAPGQL